MKDNIVLIGMPGAGKSTLGVVLAKILNYNFVDADLLIQQHCDKTLQRILDACGPDGFIEVENEVLSRIECDKSVKATGGSAGYSDEAMEHLKEIGCVVWLRISFEEMLLRLNDVDDRGVVLKGGTTMSLAEMYAERLPLYKKYADVSVDVGGLPITIAAQKVIAAIK
ncbi:MAG: shikimate kinase [Eggerthellaceae bacterium]|nr:shikimate kinase [Eggerthellaceae bacterium]